MSTPTVISHALHWVSLGPGDRLSIDIEHTEYGERLPHEWTAHQMATSSQAPIYFTPDFWAPEPSWTVSKDEAFRRKLSNLRQLHVPGNPTTSHSKGNNLRHSRSLYVRRVSNDSNLNVKYKVRSPITTSRPIYTINESEQTEAVPVKDEASLNEEDASSPDTIPGPTTPTHVSPLSNYSALSSSKSAPLSIISPLSRPSTILEAAPARDTSNELWEFEINPIPPWALTHNVREFLRYELRQCGHDINVESIAIQQSMMGDSSSAKFIIKGERRALVAFGILSSSTWWGNYLNPTKGRIA